MATELMFTMDDLDVSPERARVAAVRRMIGALDASPERAPPPPPPRTSPRIELSEVVVERAHERRRRCAAASPGADGTPTYNDVVSASGSLRRSYTLPGGGAAKK